MITILSPSKTLDMTFDGQCNDCTIPHFIDKSKILIEKLRGYDIEKLRKIMTMSPAIAERTRMMITDFDYNKIPPPNSKPALLSFKGGVYLGLDAGTLSKEEYTYAQSHVRVLSGLYGILCPMDWMQAYRLEMGSRIKINGYPSLVHFWKESITTYLNEQLTRHTNHTLINLASQEYFNAVDTKNLSCTVIKCDFKEYRGNTLKFITFNVKKARGLMTRYIIKNKIDKVEDLKGFDYDNYTYSEELSTDETLMFVR